MDFKIIDELAPYKNIYKARREDIVEQSLALHQQDGIVVLFAPTETHGNRFVQDSNFYYFTGMDTAIGSVMILDQTEHAFYVPRYRADRSVWVYNPDEIHEKRALRQGFNSFGYIGAELSGLHIDAYIQKEQYEQVISLLIKAVQEGKKIYTIYPAAVRGDIRVRLLLERIVAWYPVLAEALIDISPLVARMRRKKSKEEVELIYKAVEITNAAHQAGAYMIKPGKNEAEVQAAIEYIFTEYHSVPAYETIVAGGAQATVLHYDYNKYDMQEGELVVVDAGARYDYYCADITRTYPVSGTFSTEEKELYNLVLAVQEEVALLARPGMWLVNKHEPEHSLHHIAVKLFKQAGYEEWFTHSIGHFMGLDVHDVGDYADPLTAGDVITIEPGLYMPHIELGIRIEDNYWITQDDAPVCISQDIAKTVEEIESIMAVSVEVDLD